MNKYFLACILFFSIANELYAKHYILGTDTYFAAGKYEVISDIEVSNLKIRHVRHIDSTICEKSSQHKDHIEMDGPINPDTPFIIERLLRKIEMSPNRCMSPKTGNPFAVHVYMNSGGGYMKDGYALGRILRREYAETIITNTGECYSSCATAFIAGGYRTMEGESKLMFHAPYSYTSQYDISCNRKDNQLLDYMKEMLNETDGQFLYERTMSYCSKSSGWTLNKDAAEIFGLVNSK